MNHILERIVASKRQEITASRARVPEQDLLSRVALRRPSVTFAWLWKKGRGLALSRR